MYCDPIFDRKGGGVSYNDARKKVPEHHSSLHPSEKELPEWRSGMFWHKKKIPLPITISKYLKITAFSNITLKHHSTSMRLHVTVSHKTVIFILALVKTQNLIKYLLFCI
jgi:hypothetical protein